MTPGAGPSAEGERADLRARIVSQGRVRLRGDAGVRGHWQEWGTRRAERPEREGAVGLRRLTCEAQLAGRAWVAATAGSWAAARAGWAGKGSALRGSRSGTDGLGPRCQRLTGNAATRELWRASGRAWVVGSAGEGVGPSAGGCEPDRAASGSLAAALRGGAGKLGCGG